MRDLYARFGGGLATIFLSLVLIWLAAMVLAPNLMMIDYALRPNLPPAQIGSEADTWSLGVRYSFGGGLQARDRAGAGLNVSSIASVLGGL